MNQVQILNQEINRVRNVLSKSKWEGSLRLKKYLKELEAEREKILGKTRVKEFVDTVDGDWLA